jgi:hypothetical protein
MIAVQLLNITGHKRKLMQVNFGAMSSQSCSLCKVAYNVFGLGEEAVNKCSKELLMFKIYTNAQ